MGKNVIEAVLRAKDETSQGLTDAQKNLKKFGDTATKVGGKMVLAAGVITGAFHAMSKSTYDYGEAHLKVSKQTGLTVEQSQKLAYAAKQEHADFESLTKGFPILTKYMGYARDGMETYKREFDKMGISVTDGEGNLRSAYDVLMDMSDYMANDGVSDQEKLASAMGLLGRRGAELIPFLKLGRGGIEELGVELETTRGVMSETEATAMKNYNDGLLKLKTTFAGVKDQISVAVLPVLQKILDWGQSFAQWFKDLSPEMKSFLSKFALMGMIGVGIIGTGLLLAGSLSKTAISMITLAKATGLMNAAGALNIGVLAAQAAMAGKLLLALIGILALEEAIMAIKGIGQAKSAGAAARERLKGLEALESEYESGNISKEEFQKRVRDFGPTEKEKGTYSQTWGMTGLERVGYEYGRFQQIQANFSFTKEEEAIWKMTENLKPLLAGQ